jgi:hypothetical protein
VTEVEIDKVLRFCKTTVSQDIQPEKRVKSALMPYRESRNSQSFSPLCSAMWRPFLSRTDAANVSASIRLAGA